MALSTCPPFTIETTDPATVVVARVRELVVANGGAFAGTDSEGEFSGSTPLGKIVGRYYSYGPRTGFAGAFVVTITAKPWLVRCSTVEQQIRAYFAGGRKIDE
jgi:hypothetical protein